jgi:hypothetical protein
LTGVSPTLILLDDRSASPVPVPRQNGQPSAVFNGHSRTVLIVASLARSRLTDCLRRPPEQPLTSQLEGRTGSGTRVLSRPGPHRSRMFG